MKPASLDNAIVYCRIGDEPKWRNRQTRCVQGAVGFMPMWVQFPPSAQNSEASTCLGVFFSLIHGHGASPKSGSTDLIHLKRTEIRCEFLLGVVMTHVMQVRCTWTPEKGKALHSQQLDLTSARNRGIIEVAAIPVRLG